MRVFRVGRLRWAAAALWFGAVMALAPAAEAQNAVRGKQLYFSTNAAPRSCGTTGCHDGFPGVRKNKINNGANNPTKIMSAIAAPHGVLARLARGCALGRWRSPTRPRAPPASR
ncbi:MAG: hypothetical protein U5L03_05340 [Burkholderiaceae bacterium]|nr:hypothetical protein [Burkholderiaceae bacterium]